MAKSADIYAGVTARIVEKLESGVSPWARGWVGSAPSRPLRSCGSPYNGVNVLVLWLESMERGYSSPYWLTYKQAEALGGQVRKGSKSTRVVYFSVLEKEGQKPDGSAGVVKIPFVREYCVFNADQIDGLPDRFYPDKGNSEGGASAADRLEAVDTFAEHTGAAISWGGLRACYSPASDNISMPEYGRFTSPESYASTLLHELTHWTAKQGRCGRDLSGRFGSESYAMEELVAELGAAFALADLGVASEPRDDHASYLASWLKVLKADSRAIFTAASKASEAVAYLHSLQPGAVVAESVESEAVGV